MFNFLRKVLGINYFPDTKKELIGYTEEDGLKVLYIMSSPGIVYHQGDKIKFVIDLKKDLEHEYLLWDTSEDYLCYADLSINPKSDMTAEVEITLLKNGTVNFQIIKLAKNGEFISTYGNKITLNVLPSDIKVDNI